MHNTPPEGRACNGPACTIWLSLSHTSSRHRLIGRPLPDELPRPRTCASSSKTASSFILLSCILHPLPTFAATVCSMPRASLDELRRVFWGPTSHTRLFLYAIATSLCLLSHGQPADNATAANITAANNTLNGGLCYAVHSALHALITI